VKLSGRDARRIPDRPEARYAGYLFYGEDGSEVMARKERLIAALTKGDDMSLVRMDGQAARRDPAALADALRASGFFSGRPVVSLDGVTDGVTDAIATAVKGLGSEEGVLVCSAKLLPTRSKLRKFFEFEPHMACAPVYDDPPDAAEISELLRVAGAPPTDDAGMDELLALGRGLDSGTFRGTVVKLGLYMHGAPGPTRAADVAACAPPGLDADADALVGAVAGGQAGLIAGLMARLSGQGQAPSGLAIAASRRFRQMHQLRCAPEGPDVAANRLRPPLGGPRRQKVLQDLQRWPMPRLEQAMATLMDAELSLRSSSPAPDWASLERALVRVSMMAGR
jgi:DNA polymerase-3 subunit delta